ncbi:MAG: hypothetical protein ACK502_01585 [Alphaproteobacteria bacterium]
MTAILRITTKALLMVVALVSLQACSPASGTDYTAVAEAYDTSGVMPVTPYTRTIFSSHNF